MKYHFKKVLSCLMATSCVIGLLAGCGDTDKASNSNSSSSSEKKESTIASEQTQTAVSSSESASAEPGPEAVTYPLEGDIKLSYAFKVDKSLSANFKNMSETPFARAWQDSTGVTIEFEQYDTYEALNLMLASGDLPDIIYYNTNDYPGGVAGMIADGVAIPINGYLEYAPDYMNVLNSDEILYKSVVTKEGDIPGFPTITGDEYLKTSTGLVIRQDMLDKIKKDIPQTAEEFYEVLKALKEQLNIEAPFSITMGYLFNNAVLKGGLLTSPFNLPKGDFYVEDGQVHLGTYEQEYKEVLAYLAKLYDEKLLDNNFATLDLNVTKSNFMNGISAATVASVGSDIGNFMTTMKDTEFDCIGFGPLVAEKGDVPMCTMYANAQNGLYHIITPACEDPVAAVKFLNYGYSDEGHMLMSFGIEGESYTMVNGYPTYTETITNNENGWTMQQGLVAYSRAGHSGPYVTDKRYLEQYSSLPQQVASITQWAKSRVSEYWLPSTQIAEDDLAEYTKLYSDIDTYQREMFIKFVTGEEDINNFESVYLATLKMMDVERVIEIQQEAYDEFMAR